MPPTPQGLRNLPFGWRWSHTQLDIRISAIALR